MSRTAWSITILLALLIGCGPIFGLSAWANQQFTHFRDVQEFRLASEDARFGFSPVECSGQWLEKKIFATDETRGFVIDKIAEAWESRPGTASLRYEEGLYVEDRLSAVELRSKVIYDSYPYLYSVSVTNEVKVQFPTRICELLN